MVRLLFITLLFFANSHAKEQYNSETGTQVNKVGFYFYDDPDTNTTKKIRVTPTQKMQADLTQELIKQMKRNNELQEKILKKLEYAFPRTIPEYTTNKKTGEKCRTNSSADCFVMPVTKEAQNNVPVMAEMLRNPTEKNIQKYIEWQSVYFNRNFKIGQGFSLVSKQYEREVNKMDGMSFTQMPTHSSKQNDIAFIKKSAIVKKLGKKLGLMLFVGKTRGIEREFVGNEYLQIMNTQLGKMKNLTYVYASNKDKEFVEAKIKKFASQSEKQKYSKTKVAINAQLFKKFKISATPQVVLLYKQDNGNLVWQKIGHSIAPQAILRNIYRFLQFNDVVKPGTINEKDNWEMTNSLLYNRDFTKKELESIDINESKMKINSDQIIKGN